MNDENRLKNPIAAEVGYCNAQRHLEWVEVPSLLRWSPLFLETSAKRVGT